MNSLNHNNGAETEEVKSLPNLVKDITFFYVKFYYDKYLKDNNLELMNADNIEAFINTYYIDKKQDLKNYIRSSLKKNQGENYNSIATENIILEIFTDEEMGKERIRAEIIDFQNNVAN